MKIFNLFKKKKKEEEVKIINIKNNSGGYNFMCDHLVFDSDMGAIAFDLRSGLEVAYTLIDCLNLDYHKNTVADAEDKIVDIEEGVSH